MEPLGPRRTFSRHSNFRCCTPAIFPRVLQLRGFADSFRLFGNAGLAKSVHCLSATCTTVFLTSFLSLMGTSREAVLLMAESQACGINSSRPCASWKSLIDQDESGDPGSHHRLRCQSRPGLRRCSGYSVSGVRVGSCYRIIKTRFLFSIGGTSRQALYMTSLCDGMELHTVSMNFLSRYPR